MVAEAGNGRLVIHFGADTGTVHRRVVGLKSTLRDLDETVKTGARGYSAGATRMLEFGRAAEDAAAGFSTRGLSGAILGATNNVAAFATTFSPIAGGLVGLAGAGVLVANALYGVSEGAKTATESWKELSDEIGKTSRERSAFAFGLQHTGTADSLSGIVEREQERLGSSDAEINARHDAIQNAERELADRRKQLRDIEKESASAGAPGRLLEFRGIERSRKMSDLQSQIDERVKFLEEENKALNKSVNDRNEISSRLLVANRQLDDALIKEGSARAEQAQDRLDKLGRAAGKAFQDKVDAEMLRLEGEERQERDRLASGVVNRLRTPEMTLTASAMGTTGETSAIARALRMNTTMKDPTPEAIDRAVKQEIVQLKRHETLLEKIKTAAEKIQPTILAGVP